MGCGSGESQEKDRKVRPQRAADTGVGRDAEQQSPDRQLVVMGWTGIAGSLWPPADVTVTLCSHPFPFHLGTGGQMAFWGPDSNSKEKKVRPCSEKVSLSPESKRQRKKKGWRWGGGWR